MASYQDLEVWKEGIGLVKKIYALTDTFPAKERFRLIDQLCRAASSIPANIAEGSARKSTKDFMRFVAIALGSLAELRTHLVIARELGYVTPGQLSGIDKESDLLGKKLQSLYNALERKSVVCAA